jgi:hypothetical protein
MVEKQENEEMPEIKEWKKKYLLARFIHSFDTIDLAIKYKRYNVSLWIHAVVRSNNTLYLRIKGSAGDTRIEIPVFEDDIENSTIFSMHELNDLMMKRAKVVIKTVLKELFSLLAEYKSFAYYLINHY